MNATRQLLGSLLALSLFSILALAQSEARLDSVATVSADRTEVRWTPLVAGGRFLLTVSRPDGSVFRKEFNGDGIPSFKLVDDNGNNPADGQYSYELRLIPNLSQDVRDALASSREKGNSGEVVRELQNAGRLPKQISIQSGFFSIENGVAFAGAADEPKEPSNGSNGNINQIQSKKKKKGGDTVAIQDVLTADDMIVQGSLCVGLDCVVNEAFKFDTIRMKENNTRIQFLDTSTAAGFASTDWQLTANDSESGGANKFSIEDLTGSKVPFTISGGAPTNSLFVSSTGRIGVGTSTPGLDLHITNSDTPAHRFEQTAGGGFTAQTWDIGANEANFFVRDVTGGSHLPFRIRPGAPTSSIDISANGDVGIGIASPSRRLEIAGTSNPGLKITHTGINGAFLVYLRNSGTQGRQFSILDENAVADRFIINSSGQIGIGGLLTPTNPLEHANGAKLTAGGVWTNASSRALKTNIHRLTADEAMRTVLALNPIKFEYKTEPGQVYNGFIAEDVPHLVASNDRKTLSSMDIVAVLTKVVQEQQKTIQQLNAKMARLERRVANATGSRRARK